MNIIKSLCRQFGYELINAKNHPALMPHVMELIRRNRTDLVLDVGANRGQFARNLRSFGYRGEIHSFEPVDASFLELQKLSSKDDLWSVHKIALSDQDGTQTITVSSASDLSSFLKPSALGKQRFKQLGSGSQETVDLRTLDSIAEELFGDWQSRRVFLKMDTQGYDLKVFAGAREFAAVVHCIQTEIAFLHIYEAAPRYRDALAVFEEAGFRVTGFYPITRDEELSIIEMDCILLRPNQQSTGGR